MYSIWLFGRWWTQKFVNHIPNEGKKWNNGSYTTLLHRAGWFCTCRGMRCSVSFQLWRWWIIFYFILFWLQSVFFLCCTPRVLKFYNKFTQFFHVHTLMNDESAMTMPCNISGINVDIVDNGTRNKYANDMNESPVAKYLNVISSFVFNGIAKRNFVSCRCNWGLSLDSSLLNSDSVILTIFR